MNNISAGILMYRIMNRIPEVMLCHAGGLHNRHRDEWGIPKGMQDPEDRNHIGTAIREFGEETGYRISFTDNLYHFDPLPAVRSGSGKMVLSFAWKPETNIDISKFYSNKCEYPIGSGIMIPEIDCYRWFTIPEAYEKIYKYMQPLLRELENIIESKRASE